MCAGKEVAMAAAPTFELPDTIAALPPRAFEFSARAREEADAIVRQRPDELFLRLLRDQESEAVLLVARRVIDAFLRQHTRPHVRQHTRQHTRQQTGVPADGLPDDASAGDIAAHVAKTRAGLAVIIGSLPDTEPDTRDTVLRQRAPLGLLGGCWLDVLSQPATQPSVVVNRLFAQHFTQRGEGNPRRSLHYLRRRRMEEVGIYLPETGAADFLARAGARPLTALHGSFYLALSRLPASFLPELVGVHYVFHALGVDDLLLGMAPMLPEPALRDVLVAYLELAGPAERRRLF